MAGQYTARHKGTAIEVQVTFLAVHDEEKRRSVKAVVEAFARFLGQLESEDPIYYRAVMAYMLAMLGSVDKALADLKSHGSYSMIVQLEGLRK